MIGAAHAGGRRAAASPFLTLYLAGFFGLFATHLDFYLEASGRLTINPIAVFVGACGPFLLWLAAGAGSDRAVGRAVEALHASATPLIFFALWLAGHVIFLRGAPLGAGGADVEFLKFFPLYQLAVFLFGLLLASTPGFAEAFRHAAAIPILLLAGSILYDAFLPGTFSRAEGRAAGFGMNANVAAFDLLLILAAALRYGSARPIDAALIGVSLVAVFFTFSRGGLLLGAVLLAIYGASILAGRSGASRGGRPARLALPIAGVMAAAAALYWLAGSAAIVERPDSVGRLAWFGATAPAEGQGESRVQLLHHYLALVEQRPLLGHGTGAMLAETPRAPWGEGPHNMYLRVWLDHGVWGLATYLGLLVSILAICLGRGSWPGVALSAIVMANGAFSHDIIDDKTVLLLLGAALATSALERDDQTRGRAA